MLTLPIKLHNEGLQACQGAHTSGWKLHRVSVGVRHKFRVRDHITVYFLIFQYVSKTW